MPRFEVPGDDAFFVYSVSDELSQMVLYHGLGESIANARRADILFLGNSRMPVGLREEVIAPAAEALGLAVFSIACGHSDRTSFALELIRKHDLRPKVVVVSGGPHIFEEGLSAVAERAMASSRWAAWNEWREASAAWAVQVALHRRIPKLDLYGQDLSSPWIIYRSTRTGWWRPALETTDRFPVAFAAELPSYEWTLPLARELHDELEARGALLVLTMVPYGDTRNGHIPFLAAELGVPAVDLDFGGMFTSDNSHLHRDSALRISTDFWERLISDPEVRERLALPLLR